MFDGAESFNHDISGWDVSKVRYMGYMFNGAKSFNQDISGWDVSGIYYEYMNVSDMFNGCPCPEEYQPKFKQIQQSINNKHEDIFGIY